MNRTKLIAIMLGLTCGWIMSDGALAVSVKHMNLEEITSTARTIFSGRCTGSESKVDAETGRDAVFYTFSVSKVIKGTPAKEYTLKMSKVAVNALHTSLFKKGDEVVLFLYGKSTLGFSSPVGLGQGKFRVKYSHTGEKLVVNERNNRNLFSGVDRAKYMKKFTGSDSLAKIESTMASPQGTIDYHTFVTLIEGILD